MKKVTFYQLDKNQTVDLTNNLTYELTDETNVNTLVGNFYEMLSFFKNSNAKLFNFSLPVLVRVENVNDENEHETILNTGLAFTQLQQKCKLQWNKKGRTRFKNNVSICIEASRYQIKQFTTQDFETLNEKLG